MAESTRSSSPICPDVFLPLDGYCLVFIFIFIMSGCVVLTERMYRFYTSSFYLYYILLCVM